MLVAPPQHSHTAEESSGSNRVAVLANGSLFFDPFQEGDSGVYWCVATNGAGRDNATILLQSGEPCRSM